MPNGLFLNLENGIITLGVFEYILYVLAGSLAIGIVIHLVFFRKKERPPSLTPETLEAIVSGLGGYENIVVATSEGSRLRVQVENVKKCDCGRLKQQGASGIFVSGKQLKFTLSMDPRQIVTEIEAKKKEGQND